MPIKNLTLGCCLLLTGTALAHDREYRVQPGDTLASISAKFHVGKKKILHVNDLMPNHHMRPGHYLLIPGASDALDHQAHKNVPSGTHLYTVRNGEFDWAIAKRYHISDHKLRQMNPNVNWEALRVGIKIKVPGSSGGSVSPIEHTVAHRSGGGKSHFHVVAQGENDWIIAHRAGVRIPVLKSLNPGLNLATLHVGQKICVPGSSKALALKVPKIHSSRVAIAGDDVTIRRDPGSGAESITTVDRGLHAAVLDRDGNWYELRFPKGTVGWVRGDLLKAVHVATVATRTGRNHRRVHTYVSFHRRRGHHGNPGEHVSTSELMAMDMNAGDAEGVLEKAHSMLGTRYRWGSASRSGTDCSGFTTQVFRSQGVRLPRTSREQSAIGQRVPYGQLKPGDLVFFHTGRGSRVTHVAIYEGKGKIIHASSSGGHVQINSIADGYYRHRFVGGRRVRPHKTVQHKVVKTEVAKAEPAKVEKQETVEEKTAK